MRLNVRCCCQPKKILGSVDVPASAAYRGGTVQFLLLDAPLTFGSEPRYSYLRLPMEVYRDSVGDELAIKSNETPIETLRRLPGFIEAGTNVG